MEVAVEKHTRAENHLRRKPVRRKIITPPAYGLLKRGDLVKALEIFKQLRAVSK